jgi:hypothetical protein
MPPMPIKWIGPISRGNFMRFSGLVVPALNPSFQAYQCKPINE